jgi:hypothetical protein
VAISEVGAEVILPQAVQTGLADTAMPVVLEILEEGLVAMATAKDGLAMSSLHQVAHCL